MTMDEQVVDLYKPIRASRAGAPPLALRVTTQVHGDYVAGGVAQTSLRNETYVLLSALPEELRERVRTAVTALMSGQ